MTRNEDGTESETNASGQTWQSTFTPWRNLIARGSLRWLPSHNGWLPEGTPMRVGLTWTHAFTVTGGREIEQRTRRCEVTAHAPSVTIGGMTFQDVFTTTCANQLAGRSHPRNEVVLWGPGRVFLRYSESSVSMIPRVTEIVAIAPAMQRRVEAR